MKDSLNQKKFVEQEEQHRTFTLIYVCSLEVARISCISLYMAANFFRVCFAQKVSNNCKMGVESHAPTEHKPSKIYDISNFWTPAVCFPTQTLQTSCIFCKQKIWKSKRLYVFAILWQLCNISSTKNHTRTSAILNSVIYKKFYTDWWKSWPSVTEAQVEQLL